MKARSTVNALLAVAEQLIAAKKAARSKRALSPVAPSAPKVVKFVPEDQSLLMRLTAQWAS